MKIIMDTHIHSKASDGMWTPSEVVQNAKERGLESIAITDHDTTYGIEEAIEEGNRLGIRVIPGIEIDAEYNLNSTKVKNIELIGLCIDHKHKIMIDFVRQKRKLRLQALATYVDSFNDYITNFGEYRYNERNPQMTFPLERYRKLTVKDIKVWRNRRDCYNNPWPFLSKMDLVYYLLETFGDPSQLEVKKALGGDRTCSNQFKTEYRFLFENKRKPPKPSFHEAIKVVKRVGGKAILAHPGLSAGYENGMSKEWELPENQWFDDSNPVFTPYRFVADLKVYGLDGVEIYYYEANDSQQSVSQNRINHYFQKLASTLGLTVTYGSDCHGPKGNGPLMGDFGSMEIFL
jgi:hypothetical protein